MCGKRYTRKRHKRQGVFRIFQNVHMTKTLGGRKEMEREGLKKQNRKGIHFPKSLNFILYMVGNHYRSFKKASDMIGSAF